MAVTANDLRANLDDAWNFPPVGGTSLRDELVRREKLARTAVASGTITKTSGNMRSVEFSDRYGPGAITPVEAAQIWRELINSFGEAILKLTFWAARGIDPYVVERQGQPYPTPSATVSPPLIVDTIGQWAALCLEHGEKTTDVIGKVVGDAAAYLWMMDHIVSVKESRPDFSDLRIGSGMAWA